MSRPGRGRRSRRAPSNHTGRGGVVDVGAPTTRAEARPGRDGHRRAMRPRALAATWPKSSSPAGSPSSSSTSSSPIYANADRGRHSTFGRCVRQEVVEESEGEKTVGEPGRRVEVHVQGETRFEQLSGGDVDVDQHDARAVVNGSGRRVQQEPTILARRRARILELERATLA